MTERNRIPSDLAKHIAAVTNKRARFVLDTIAKKGMVTTEEINGRDTNIRLAPYGTHASLGSPFEPSKQNTRTDGRSQHMSFLKMPASGAARAGGALLPRSKETRLSKWQGRSARFAGQRKIFKLTIACHTRSPASLPEAALRSSWFFAVPATARNHGAVSTAQTGPASAV